MKQQYRKSIFALMLLTTMHLGLISAQAHVEGHMPDSVAEMEYRIFLEFKPNNVETRVKLATVLMNQDKLAEAEKEFNRCLDKSPRNLQANMGLSQLKLKQHKTSEALNLIKKAKGIDQDNPAVYLHYGQILEANDQTLEAKQMYKAGLEKILKNPKNLEVQHDRKPLEDALQKLEEKPVK